MTYRISIETEAGAAVTIDVTPCAAGLGVVAAPNGGVEWISVTELPPDGQARLDAIIDAVGDGR